MLERGVSNFGQVILFILIGAFFVNGCSFSKKEINLLLIHDTSSSYIANQLEALCREQGFILQKTTDLSYCLEDSLKGYNTVILDIPIDTLEHRQQIDLERYVLAGGGLLGINLHTSYIHKWPWMEAFLHQEAEAQEVRDPFALLTSAKTTNAVEGITKNYGTGRVCFIYTHRLSTAKKNLANAVSYTIDHENELHYQDVSIPRVPSSQPFSDVVLVNDLSEPVDMEVLPQGDVIFIERSGIVKFFNAKSYETKQIAHINISKHDGFGLTSMALDPDFKKNHWIYFGYTPLSDPQNQYISRYFLAEDSLILRTEKILMKIAASPSVLSLLEFDENRNILAGFSPSSSEGAGRFVTQDTSLYSDSQNSVIYGRQAKILKLPIDPDTTLQISWARANNDSIFQMKDYYLPKTHPQYFGFSDEAPASKWGGISIFQDSISHTRSLYGKQYKFPYLASGNYFVTGPIYHTDPHSTSVNKFPDYYSNKLFVADVINHRLLVATLNRNKQLYVIEPFQNTLPLDNPVRLKFDSEGALYVLEHGPVGYVSHHHARLRRITYANTNRPPVAKIEANERSGSLPLTVNFSARASFDYDPDDSLRFEWVFPDTVIYTNTNLRVQYTFNEPGVYQPAVKVYDQTGSVSEASITVVAGNSKPEISFETEINRSFYWKSSTLPYSIKIADEEDGLTDTTSSLANIRLYEHPREQWYYTANAQPIDSEGTLVLETPPKDSLKDYTLVVSYQDQGANGVASHNTETVFPIRSPQLFATDADGSKDVLMRVDQKAWFTQNEAYILFKDIDMREINHLKYRIKPLVDGFVELRLNAPNGPVVSTFRISSKEDWAAYTVRVGQIEGSYDLYFVFRQSEESVGTPAPEILCMLEWIYFGKEKKGNFYINPDANDML